MTIFKYCVCVSGIETPRNGAGIGIFLKGDSKGDFKSVALSESGFYAPLDAKKILPVSIDKKPCVLVANNNDKLQVFIRSIKK